MHLPLSPLAITAAIALGAGRRRGAKVALAGRTKEESPPRGTATAPRCLPDEDSAQRLAARAAQPLSSSSPESSMRKIILSAVALVVAVVVVIALLPHRAAKASPAAFTCTAVNGVAWDGRLFIDCANTPIRFIAYPGTSSCGSSSPGTQKTIDDVKVFESMASSALLAGKSLSISFEPNCDGFGNGGIYSVEIFR
jgi:hypothetical protein